MIIWFAEGHASETPPSSGPAAHALFVATVGVGVGDTSDGATHSVPGCTVLPLQSIDSDRR